MQISFIYYIMTAIKWVIHNPCIKCIQRNASILIIYLKPWQLYGIVCKKFKNVRMTKEWNLYHIRKKVNFHILQLK